MKIHRLLEMTTILLNKKTVTAAELAERFGVSTRTIYRDIDVLSASGVPVYATQGTNGGISILEDYTVNRVVLSDDEKDSVLAALHTLKMAQFPEIDSVLDKLGCIFKNKAADWLSVDFSPWGSQPNAQNRFNDIKTAIIQNKVIDIEYLNSLNKRSKRKIEPLRLIYKSQAWYLWGYCLFRQDYRTFRISRIKKVEITNEAFDRNKVHISEEKPAQSENDRPDVHLILEFTREALFRLYDDYDEEMLRDNKDGTYTLEIAFPEDEWVYSYILGFGPFVKVLEPPHIREIIKEKCKAVLSYYE